MCRAANLVRLLLVLCTSLLVSVGCSISGNSWQEVGDDTAQQLGQWRLVDAVNVAAEFRWRLPRGAHVVVRPMHETIEPAHVRWNRVAQAGLDKIFLRVPSTTKQSPVYYLAIGWPSTEQLDSEVDTLSGSVSQSTIASVLAFHEWPKFPQQGHIEVHLLAADEQPLYQASLEVSPQLWGSNWHDEKMLRTAFIDLAARLKGG